MKAAPVGTRVVVNWAHLSGEHGEIVELRSGLLNGYTADLLNGHDVAVLLDLDLGYGDAGALCFYWHELAVEK